MWEKQIKSILFKKNGKSGIVCKILFRDGKEITLHANGFTGFRDVLEAAKSKEAVA